MSRNKKINVNDIDKLLGKIELIDIREKYEYSAGSLNTAKNIPMGELVNNVEDYLSFDKEYYIMCQSGGRSQRVCNVLESEGYKVIDVVGGYGSYAGTKRNK